MHSAPFRFRFRGRTAAVCALRPRRGLTPGPATPRRPCGPRLSGRTVSPVICSRPVSTRIGAVAALARHSAQVNSGRSRAFTMRGLLCVSSPYRETSSPSSPHAESALRSWGDRLAVHPPRRGRPVARSGRQSQPSPAAVSSARMLGLQIGDVVLVQQQVVEHPGRPGRPRLGGSGRLRAGNRIVAGVRGVCGRVAATAGLLEFVVCRVPGGRRPGPRSSALQRARVTDVFDFQMAAIERLCPNRRTAPIDLP